jgi:hypothetical protein
MATILTYRNDDERPLCEIALANGDRVQLQLSNAGLVVEQIGLGDQPSAILFKADASLVSDICAALLGQLEATRTTPLDVLVTVVSQIPTAANVRESFQAAARAL